jgi:stage II sporulation protein D
MAVTSADSLIQCYYFSTCSGRTASKHEVWGGDSIPYLVSRIDTDGVGEAYCLSSKYSAWKEEWSIPQLAGILKRNLRSASITSFEPFTSIENIEITDRASCGRVRVLNITTEKGNIQVKGDKSRFALRQNGSEDKILPSAWFDIQMSGNKVTAQGHGYGHGVGLCQVGAIGRAKAGQSFKQIIDAYYTGVTIVEYK